MNVFGGSVSGTVPHGRLMAFIGEILVGTPNREEVCESYRKHVEKKSQADVHCDELLALI